MKTLLTATLLGLLIAPAAPVQAESVIRLHKPASGPSPDIAPPISVTALGGSLDKTPAAEVLRSLIRRALVDRDLIGTETITLNDERKIITRFWKTPLITRTESWVGDIIPDATPALVWHSDADGIVTCLSDATSPCTRRAQGPLSQRFALLTGPAYIPPGLLMTTSEPAWRVTALATDRFSLEWIGRGQPSGRWSMAPDLEGVGVAAATHLEITLRDPVTATPDRPTGLTLLARSLVGEVIWKREVALDDAPTAPPLRPLRDLLPGRQVVAAQDGPAGTTTPKPLELFPARRDRP